MERIEVFLDQKGEWRWRFVAANGREMADSGEGYSKKADCLSAIETLRVTLPTAQLTVQATKEDPGDGP